MAMDATKSVTPSVVALILVNPSPDSAADVSEIVVQVVDLKPIGTRFTYAITKAICIAFVMTFFSVFDVPVFWPILPCYGIVLFVLTMKRHILHMIKYKYVPFNLGKQRYGGKKGPAASGSKD